MSRSLSWIDPKALSAALVRAGVKNVRIGDEAMNVSAMTAQMGSSGTGPLPSAFFDQASTERLSRFGSERRPPSRAPRAPRAPRAAASTQPEQSAQAAPSPQPSEPSWQPTQPPATQPAVAPEAPAAEAENVTAVGPLTADIHTEEIDVGKLLDFEFDSDRLEARLEAFMTWIQLCTQCHGIFIVDEEGLVLMEKGSDPDLVALSAYFLNFQDRIRSCLGSEQHGSIAIDLDGGHVLHVVQAETELGPHALGFTVSRPLKRALTRHFHEKLPFVFSMET